VESARLAARLDADDYAAIIRRFFDVAGGVIDRHGRPGSKPAGDGVPASFGLAEPQVDAAVRAVTAAFELRSAIWQLSREEFEGRWDVKGCRAGWIYILGSIPVKRI